LGILMKIVAALVSLLVVVLNLVLIHRSPVLAHASLRLVLFRMFLWMLAANAMLWFSQQSDWRASTRFQLFIAGWILILVQLGNVIYLLNSGV